jgi:hypothetical protein
MLSRAVVVFLVFGFFGGPKLGIYMYRDASTKTLFEIRAAQNTFELSFFLSTVVSISRTSSSSLLSLVRLYFLDLTSCSRPLT